MKASSHGFRLTLVSLWFIACKSESGVVISPERTEDLSTVSGPSSERASSESLSEQRSSSEVTESNPTTLASNMSRDDSSAQQDGPISLGQSSTFDENTAPGECSPRAAALIELYGDCFNSAQSDDETDVDCGGPDCKRCALGEHCEWDGDCVSRHCTAGDCTETGGSDGVPPETGGVVGTRCDTDGDCEVDLYCKGDFGGERPICSKACTSDPDCPNGSKCVEGILNVSSQPSPGYCVRPCELSPDCETYGSECDGAPGGGGRYCF